MNTATQQTVVHALALAAGVLSIVAGSAAALGLPPYAAAVVGVVISVLVYVGNQLPNLGTPATPSQPPAPEPPPHG